MVRRALLFALGALVLAGCGPELGPVSPTPGPIPMPTPAPSAPFSQTDLRVGAGEEAVNGMMIAVFYTGWLYDPSAADQKGAMFDTNVGGRYTFPFFLGRGQACPGWDQGIVGMRVGGLRRLIIPPELAHGGGPALPRSVSANSTLVYEIDLDDAWWED